jgi:hypothetical protein
MTLIEIPDAVHAFLGACGSALSMLWIQETTAFRRLVLFLGGTVFSAVATPDVAQRVHVSANLLALMLGVVSMVVIAKLFETFRDFNLGKLARDVAYKWAGLKSPTTRPAPLTEE